MRPATSGILKSFITEIENLVDKKVKIIRCDNGTEFKNRVMSEFCEKKGIKKEFSVARTPQQNGVAERRNRTLIEAARTMLADSKLPTTFWAEAVNTACYVQNRVLVVKPHNKTPYELFRGRTPALSFMRPFGCHVTILNTLDYLGKFDGKSDEGFFVGYSMNSKAFRVYNIRTRKVEENLHIRFLEDKPIIAGDGPKWLFDIDVLTKSMNYVPVVAGTNSNDFVGTKESIGVGHSSKETGSSQDYILMPLWKDGLLFDSSSKNASNDEPQPPSDAGKKDDEGVCKESGIDDQERPENSTQDVNTVGPSINTEPDMFSLGDNATLEATHADFFGDETKVDISNITTTYQVSSTPNTRIHKDHSLAHVIGDVQSGVQTRRMTKTTNEQGFISVVYEGKTHEDLHTCLFTCFLSQEEPKRIAKALSDSDWVEIFRNKKDERGIVIQNKARLVAQGHTQEEGIDYDEVFAPVARIKVIRMFLAYTSFMGFMVYQMDVKSAFLYDRIKEEVYVCQPPGFEDLEYPDKVYKVVKALYGLHQAPRAWYETLAKYLLDNGFHRGKIDQTLFIKKQKGDIFLVQVYVDDIIFGSTKKELCIEFEKLMNDKFQMSSIGELTFLLGLQVKQKEDGIFISQDKASTGYTREKHSLFRIDVQGKGSTHPIESHHTPTSAPLTSQPPISPTSRRTTRQESVGSGNIDKTPTMPHDSPLLRVNTLGSDEGISTAEKDVSTAESVSTAGAAVTTTSVVVSTVSPTRNTGVYNADDITMAETMVYIRKSAVKDKAAMRLQAKLEEEERQRIVRSDPEADPEEDDDEDPEEGSYAPSAEETEPFETDESAATPPPHPEYRVTTQDFYSRLLSTARSLELNMTQHLRTRLEEDTNEIYTRLDDEQSQRQLLAGRLNMLFRDRRAHAYTRHQMETEARLSREAWRRSMDASDLTRVGVMSLRTIVLGQMSDIRELQDTDRRRQAMDLECLKADIGDLQR
ncbi:hypothetical protein Tco_0602057 [Tanacetum coccineum]